MSGDEIKTYLENKFPGKSVKYVGCGTDSVAFKVGDVICRFPHRTPQIYETEAAVCDFIRPNVTVNIPRIEIVSDGKYIYAMHQMITGNKWSWHKFMWQPRRQRNLAKTYARFLAQLHSCNADDMVKKIPALKEHIPYCDFDEIKDFLSQFMTPGQMRCFRKNYERIITAPVSKKDLVFIHMGMKGANSVVDADGNISGVFDFCSGGIYERWRDLVLAYLGHNSRLYRAILSEYSRQTGIAADKSRVADLAVIEFLWRRRLYPNGTFAPRNNHFIMKNIAFALARFHHMPRRLSWIIYARMSLYARSNNKKNNHGGE